MRRAGSGAQTETIKKLVHMLRKYRVLMVMSIIFAAAYVIM